MSGIKLFCIPYSGGIAGNYFKWKKSLLPEIELIPVETAGHGKRMKEEFYEDVAAAADDLSDKIMEDLQGDEPYAIFGHSLGALFVFETYYALKRKGAHEPAHIFFSGRTSPDDSVMGTEYYKLPEDQFMIAVASYGGGTADLMQNRELLDIFVPILRADFRLGETYEYVPYDEKIMCDITVLNGDNDYSLLNSNLESWTKHAGKNIEYLRVKGEHFYIIENIEDTVAVINNILEDKMQ